MVIPSGKDSSEQMEISWIGGGESFLNYNFNDEEIRTTSNSFSILNGCLIPYNQPRFLPDMICRERT